jgi:hypothetical protein
MRTCRLCTGAVNRGCREPCVDPVGIEANELAHLVERHPAFGDEAPDESLGDTEALSERRDVQKGRRSRGVGGGNCHRPHLWPLTGCDWDTAGKSSHCTENRMLRRRNTLGEITEGDREIDGGHLSVCRSAGPAAVSDIFSLERWRSEATEVLPR